MDGRAGIEIHLTSDEALVLSDWISRLQGEGVPLGDEAVWMPLYAIGGAIETTLPVIFASNYKEELAAARSRLLAKMGVNEDGAED